jgi:hypothetical protein
MSDLPHAISAWLSPGQAPMLRRVGELLHLPIVRAGSPDLGQSHAVANDLLASPSTDLRQLLVDPQARVVLILAAGAFGTDPASADASILAAAAARGVRVLSLDPMPASALDLASPEWQAPGAAAAFKPLALFRHAPTVRDAFELLPDLGPIRLAHAELLASPDESSLGSRLFDGVDLLLSLMADPDTIDAAPVPPSGLPISTPDSLRKLAGGLSVHLRWTDGRAATITASNHAGGWRRRVVLIADQGRLTIDDAGIEWRDASGSLREAPHDRTPHTSAAHCIAHAVARVLEPGAPPDPPIPLASILCTAQAAMLSARTRQTESLASINRILAGP